MTILRHFKVLLEFASRAPINFSPSNGNRKTGIVSCFVSRQYLCAPHPGSDHLEHLGSTVRNPASSGGSCQVHRESFVRLHRKASQARRGDRRQRIQIIRRYYNYNSIKAHLMNFQAERPGRRDLGRQKSLLHSLQFRRFRNPTCTGL